MPTQPFEEYTNQPSRDKVTPPVRNQTLAFAGVGVVIALVLRTFLDWEVDPKDAETWWNSFQSIVVPLIPAVTALFGSIRGARKAKEEVTPISDPFLWDEASESWQPAQVMPRAANPYPSPDRPRRQRPR